MDLSLSKELHLFSQELQRLLSPVVLQDIAKQVGFVQRSVSIKQTNSWPFVFGLAKKSPVHHLRNYVVG